MKIKENNVTSDSSRTQPRMAIKYQGIKQTNGLGLAHEHDSPKFWLHSTSSNKKMLEKKERKIKTPLHQYEFYWISSNENRDIK
jgi:hypothetical protein